MAGSREVARHIRESLGLPQKPTASPTVPIEGHVADFPFWSYSDKRLTAQALHIDYPDGSFFTLEAPKSMPGPSFPGYLDCILYSGQRDLFVQEYVEISVYKIFKTLEIDPSKGKNYANFRRDMERAFALYMKTDRFRNPATGKRSHVEYFRALQRMSIAKTSGSWQSMLAQTKPSPGSGQRRCGRRKSVPYSPMKHRMPIMIADTLTP